MNLIKKAPLAVLMAASMGSAAATPVSVSGQFDSGNAQPIAAGTLPYSFTLDISGNFAGGLDTLTSGVLTLLLGDPDGGKEKFLFGLGAGQSFSKPGEMRTMCATAISAVTASRSRPARWPTWARTASCT